MPIRVTSFYLPVSPSIPYILEDVYVRGGFRSVATTAARDEIAAMAKKVGMLVYCEDVDKYFRLGADKLTWYEFSSGSGSGGSGGTRKSKSITTALIASGDSLNLSLDLESATVMVIELTLDTADIKVQVFSKSDQSDQNPYTFISSSAQMSDEGLSSLNGSIERARRFSFWSTNDGSKSHQARITNIGISDAVVTINLKYLTMES